MTTTPSSPVERRPFSWRAFVSLLVAITFIVLAVTGIGLYATPDEPLRDIAKRHGRHAPEVAALLARNQEGVVTR